jgi:hypothetical protein
MGTGVLVGGEKVMEERTVKLAQGIHCDGKHCKAPLIPKGGAYVVDGDGRLLCMYCAEAPVIEYNDAPRMAGSLA